MDKTFQLKNISDKAVGSSKDIKALFMIKTKAFPPKSKENFVVTRYDKDCWIMELNAELSKSKSLVVIISFAVSLEHKYDDEVLSCFQDSGMIIDQASYSVSVLSDIHLDGKRQPKKSASDYKTAVDGKLITNGSIFDDIFKIILKSTKSLF
jgi:hypothetical protein